MFDSDSPPSSSQCDSWDYFTEFIDEFSLNWPSLTRLVSASLSAFDTSKMPITRIDMPSSIIVSRLLVTCVWGPTQSFRFVGSWWRGKCSCKDQRPAGDEHEWKIAGAHQAACCIGRPEEQQKCCGQQYCVQAWCHWKRIQETCHCSSPGSEEVDWRFRKVSLNCTSVWKP